MGHPSKDNIYGYNPSIPAAIVFAAFYLLLFFIHTYLSLYVPLRIRRSQARRFSSSSRGKHRLRHRHTMFLIPATLLAVASYGVRAASSKDTASIGLYAVSASYIVLSPIFVCASLYWQLKHLMLLRLPPPPPNPEDGGGGGGEGKLFNVLGARWVGRVFITSDVLSFLTQAAGSGIASSGKWEGITNDIGVGVLMAGLALQLATFTAFMVGLAWLGRESSRSQSRRRDGHYHGGGGGGGGGGGLHGKRKDRKGVKKVVKGVWIASVFVQMRTVYRLVEFALGIEGYPFGHEWCLYVLDGLPMVVALGVLAWWHPVRWLRRARVEEEVLVEVKGSSRRREGPVGSRV